MRLYLLPVSTRRTLLYCQRLNTGASEKQTPSDRIQAKVVRTWADWERKEAGLQKKIVNYGNYIFRRIPYEEWGLKSVPPLSQSRKEAELRGTEKVEVVYPKNLLAKDKVPTILEKLATERESLHKKRLLWCFIGMPFTAPIGLLPVYVPCPPHSHSDPFTRLIEHILQSSQSSILLPSLSRMVALEGSIRRQAHQVPPPE